MAYTLAGGWFFAAVGGHLVLMRLPVRASSVARFVLAGGLGAGGLAASLGVGLMSWPGLASLAAYAFACELYVFLFTLVVSSVSVRILFQLRENAAPSAQEEGAAMVRRRLRRMAAIGWLAPAGDGFEVTAKGRSAAAVFQAVQAFCGYAGGPREARKPRGFELLTRFRGQTYNPPTSQLSSPGGDD